MRLQIFSLALGVCLVFGSAAGQQQQAPSFGAIGTWQGNLSEGACTGSYCYLIPYSEMSVFTPTVPIVITRIEAIAIRNSKGGQAPDRGCRTAEVRLHDGQQTHAFLALLPYIEQDTIYKGVYVDSGEMALDIKAGTRLWMGSLLDPGCQIQDVRVTVQYQTRHSHRPAPDEP